jgi:hypothetical protein
MNHFGPRSVRFSTEAGRLEAFSDGVIAVIITIMVLELRPPDGTDLRSLHALIPTFSAYVLSFAFIGIYWNNHHHMLRASDGIDGRAICSFGSRSCRLQRRGSGAIRSLRSQRHSTASSC